MADQIRPLHLGVDATNIRQGGGVTHLSRLFHAGVLEGTGIDRVSVWAGQATLEALPNQPWLIKHHAAWMDAALPRRLLGQQLQLSRLVKQAHCDVFFSPGGTLPLGMSLPSVVMSQNMLPFEPREAALFGRFSAMHLKMKMLRRSQGRSFARADGLLFLTHYAHETVSNALGGLNVPVAIIPHGIEPRFLQAPRPQRSLASCSAAEPFKLLYVSILMPYKHQIEAAKAVHRLRAQGLPVEMTFIGAPWGGYAAEFQRVLSTLDPDGAFLKWRGAVPFESLHGAYQNADAFVFASSCENLPNIMIEAMAAGLPIASSNLGPMPEVLQDAGVYFSPYSYEAMADAISRLAHDASLRADLAQAAWHAAQQYAWDRCATDTLKFIAQVARDKGNRHV